MQVLLSSTGGANRGGFTIIRSNIKANIRFDGVFNIISYDAIQKFQNNLMASDFKVNKSVFSSKYSRNMFKYNVSFKLEDYFIHMTANI